ncbi:Hypothetical predicted protein [Olea europaea subsp. europaea]|uniref:DUF1985 domain-containing protein n=1 Tax=Olea europaea subsp. europaea TaxID=158383 RepID=A0A8S0U0W3_OLEEU|nr:Hypothetical predicted protein [Olea europaea subsp. europaea]
MEDKYKIGLVYILETVLLPKESYTYINLEHLLMVDDLETFNSYPWERKAFGCTIDVFMRGWKSLMKSYLINNEKYPYSIYGFPFTLQIWAYEAIPSIGWRYGENLQEVDLPRICRWNSSEMPNSKDIGASLDEPNMVEILERKNDKRIDEMRSYIDQRFDCVTSLCRQIDEKISSIVEWIKNSNPSITPYTYHSPLRSGFMNTGEAYDVNEDPLVHVEVQNDENEDVNEERQVEDYVLANEAVLVKETTLPADGNEQKQAADMNNCPNPIEVENEQRQATDVLNDDQTRVEERDTCVPMDLISHGDAMKSIPKVVKDESDKSSQNGRGMRIKKRSFILESPFTNPEKRRKLYNVNAVDPF